MKYASAKNISFDKIPIIDIVSLRNEKDKFSVAKSLHDASKNLGFIYIKNRCVLAPPFNCIQLADWSKPLYCQPSNKY